MNGFLCVYKPPGPTSFKIISQVRRALNIKKVGHCGTLDPAAEGLLLIAIGSSTRLLQYVTIEPKIYHFGIQFGSETDSCDLEGLVISQGGHFPSEIDLSKTLGHFSGRIKQVPPLFSAVKIAGTRACDLARRGVTPVLKEREITVHRLELVSCNTVNGTAELTVECSTGTYVRSLVRDISRACGTYGTATYIKRVQIGRYSTDDSIRLDETPDPLERLISAKEIFRNDVQIEFDRSEIEKIFQGRNMYIDSVSPESSLVYATFRGEIVAVLRKIEVQWYHPETVLTTKIV
ncbi:MAG: tRNA pseudouridine(55) synthase TruB [Chitinispirillaceae bacterium]|nr:tRNA pseudouridine(55) synthase TruB [Chitinispirillaceae bacterium]